MQFRLLKALGHLKPLKPSRSGTVSHTVHSPALISPATLHHWSSNYNHSSALSSSVLHVNISHRALHGLTSEFTSFMYSQMLGQGFKQKEEQIEDPCHKTTVRNHIHNNASLTLTVDFIQKKMYGNISYSETRTHLQYLLLSRAGSEHPDFAEL